MSTLAAAPSQMFVGGAWVDAAGGGRFPVRDPATGAELAQVPDAGPGDATRAVDAAAAALEAWRDRPARERARVLAAAAAELRRRAGELAATITGEQGKPLAEAAGEVEYAASFLEWFAGEAERVYGRVIPDQAPGHRSLVVRVPVGVCVAITPWNLPAAMLARKLGPALAAGCTMVVKPAEATPLTALLVAECLAAAGAPDGTVNVVTCADPGPVAGALMDDPRVRKVSFTGSTAVGQHLIRASAADVKRLSLELGGHAPFLVFEDADLDVAVRALIASKFRNAGQTCVCANRAYVHADVHDAFAERLAAAVAALRVGPGVQPGVDVGPLIDAAGLAKVEAHVADAVARGARVLCGGAALAPGSVPGAEAGHFFAPTLLAGVSPDMRICSEETFGPVIGLETFTTEADVLARANAGPYGLAGYVMTRDTARTLRVAERLEVGMVGVNTGVISAPNVPFGGVKQSGLGREGGAEGIEEYLDTRYVRLAGV